MSEKKLTTSNGSVKREASQSIENGSSHSNGTSSKQEAQSPNGQQPNAVRVFTEASSNHRKAAAATTDPERIRKQLRAERKQLPIYAARTQLLEMIKKHDTLIIVGETGSGKTTQLPQFIYESGMCTGVIACTQPRRVAAITVATRVAAELGCTVGSTVGYTIRFDDCTTSGTTRIKYATDGMLARECQSSPLLLDYDCVIIDEAHERTLQTDLLCLLLKHIQQKRREMCEQQEQHKKLMNKSKKQRLLDGDHNDHSINTDNNNNNNINTVRPLKIICMSATLVASDFSTYFNNSPVLYIAGRQHAVNIYFCSTAQQDYTTAAIATAIQLHLEKPLPGDVLLFLTGQEEIESVRRALESKVQLLPKSAAAFVVRTMYSQLSSEQQLRAIAATPAGVRKIIVATNVAETSLTIPGVVYVIDSGVVKSRCYNNSTGVDTLAVTPISQAEAWQRSGRAGRVSAGECYRLYTEYSFSQLNACIVPEILRVNLSATVLQLACLGLFYPHVKLLSQPAEAAIKQAYSQLLALDAIAIVPTLAVTAIGRILTLFPLSPHYAKMLYMSTTAAYTCAEEMLTIVAVLSGDSIYEALPNNSSKQADAVRAHSKFTNVLGDHLTMLELYNAYAAVVASSSERDQKQWCKDHYVQHRSLQSAAKARQQLLELCVRNDMPIESSLLQLDNVRRCLITGLFAHAARRDSSGNGNSYETLLKHQICFIHPSSVLMNNSSSSSSSKPDVIIYTELVDSSKKYVRDCTVIDVRWLQEIAPLLYSDSSSKTGGQTVVPAQLTKPLLKQ